MRKHDCGCENEGTPRSRAIGGLSSGSGAPSISSDRVPLPAADAGYSSSRKSTEARRRVEALLPWLRGIGAEQDTARPSEGPRLESTPAEDVYRILPWLRPRAATPPPSSLGPIPSCSVSHHPSVVAYWNGESAQPERTPSGRSGSSAFHGSSDSDSTRTPGKTRPRMAATERLCSGRSVPRLRLKWVR